MATKKKTKNQTKEEPLEKQLWKAADKLRKNIDAAEYKHVVLGLIFLKYISDAFEELYAKLETGEGELAGADPEDKDEYKAENVFFVPTLTRWSHLVAQACATKCDQRVSVGTKNTFSALYSSLSSGSAPASSPSPVSSLA